MKKIYVQHNYQKNNGRLLVYGLASSFNAWGNYPDASTGFKISKKCIDNLGYLDSEEFSKNIQNVSKNNIIINKKNINHLKNSLFINQCILLRDIKVLYLTYNTLFPNTNKIIKISLTDNNGNIIAEEPSFINTTQGLLINNYENYFWGIDYGNYENLVLHVEVSSKYNRFLYEYDQIIY